MVREENEVFFTRVQKSLPSRCVLKTVSLTTIRNRPKCTISTSGGLRLLQMVLEPDTGQCVIGDVGPRS